MEKNTTRSIISICFGLIFPLFGIYIYTKWNYMGVDLYNDVLINFSTDFKVAIYNLFTSPFKGDFFNQITQHQELGLLMQPTMSAMFTWTITGYFIGVFSKNLKKSTIIVLLTQVIILLFFIIMLLVEGTGFSYFDANLKVFLGSIFISFVFALVGNILGYFAGRQ